MLAAFCRTVARVMTKPLLVWLALGLIFGVGFSQAQTLKFTGAWQVQVTFQNGESRSLRFDARDAGKGSFALLAPRPNQVSQAELPPAEWTKKDEHSFTVSGPVIFPLGNVGLARGTLRLEGKLGTDGSFTGEAKFFPSDQDPKDPKAEPSKSGTFKANRVQG